jgi:hypothetical protein
VVRGDVLLAGSPDDDDAGGASGSVHVFRFDGQGSWAHEAKLTAANAGAGDLFGAHVALEGGLALVSAMGADRPASNSGSVYAFRYSNGQWVQEGELVPSDGAAGDEFGASLGLSGGTLLVGAPGDDDMGSGSGSVYVFERSGGAWVERAKLIAPDGGAGDRLGGSLGLSGGLAVVGAADDDDAGVNAGAAYLYRHDGAAWRFDAKLTGYDSESGDRFGDAVAAAADRVLIASTWDDDAGVNAGAAYLYEWDGAAWAARVKLVGADTTAGDFLGGPLALSGGRALLGAWQDDDAGFSTGSAYLFDGLNDCNGNRMVDLCDIVGGASADANGDFVPDECEDDCNNNGMPDSIELALGLASDCNGNGVPDECDLAAGTSVDCDGNAVPDECDLAAGAADCNANNVPDECDLANGTSEDCNGNGVPDECDLASAASADCDSNGVPDECDLANGTALDCNANGVPDSCDLASGASADCDGNGVPDECDLANGAADCDANGVPDVCEPDSDGDGVIDACDDCPETPEGDVVDERGCAELFDPPADDADGDGVADESDWCPETPAGAAVDEHGCARGQRVKLCHLEGRFGRRKTICVAPSAVAAHLAHGDALFSCEAVEAAKITRARCKDDAKRGLFRKWCSRLSGRDKSSAVALKKVCKKLEAAADRLKKERERCSAKRRGAGRR